MTEHEQTAQVFPSSEQDERVLSMRFGAKTVGENLEEAIKAGRVVRAPDGTLSLPPHDPPERISNGGAFDRDCMFLNAFMFVNIYAKKAVPIGCKDCYKVKAHLSSLRELVASKEITEKFSCRAKSVSEIDRGDNQTLYASYYFLIGLDNARAVYARVRKLVDENPRLGPSVKINIKRGCTNYERACGPSDKYTFEARQSEVEAYFQKRFKGPDAKEGAKKSIRDALILLNMARAAYRIGDQTYKDVTGGKDLFRPTVDYPPESEAL